MINFVKTRLKTPYNKIKEILKPKEQQNFNGKRYFDFAIKLFFLLIVHEIYFISVTTQWTQEFPLQVDAHLFSYIVYLLIGFILWFLTNS